MTRKFIYSSFWAFVMWAASVSTAMPFCFEEAGTLYGVAPALLMVIAQGESKMDPLAVRWNKNGSVDVGLMQINSCHISAIGKDVWDKLIIDPCLNVTVGAWYLRKCIDKYGENWQAVGCYHSQNPKHGIPYANKIYATWKRMEKQFPFYQPTFPLMAPSNEYLLPEQVLGDTESLPDASLGIIDDVVDR